MSRTIQVGASFTDGETVSDETNLTIVGLIPEVTAMRAYADSGEGFTFTDWIPSGSYQGQWPSPSFSALFELQGTNLESIWDARMKPCGLSDYAPVRQGTGEQSLPISGSIFGTAELPESYLLIAHYLEGYYAFNQYYWYELEISSSEAGWKGTGIIWSCSGPGEMNYFENTRILEINQRYLHPGIPFAVRGLNISNCTSLVASGDQGEVSVPLIATSDPDIMLVESMPDVTGSNIVLYAVPPATEQLNGFFTPCNTSEQIAIWEGTGNPTLWSAVEMFQPGTITDFSPNAPSSFQDFFVESKIGHNCIKFYYNNYTDSPKNIRFAFDSDMGNYHTLHLSSTLAPNYTQTGDIHYNNVEGPYPTLAGGYSLVTDIGDDFIVDLGMTFEYCTVPMYSTQSLRLPKVSSVKITRQVVSQGFFDVTFEGQDFDLYSNPKLMIWDTEQGYYNQLQNSVTHTSTNITFTNFAQSVSIWYFPYQVYFFTAGNFAMQLLDVVQDRDPVKQAFTTDLQYDYFRRSSTVILANNVGVVYPSSFPAGTPVTVFNTPL